MAYLTSQMRAIIRAQVLSQMTSRCTIEREANSRDAIGGMTHDWEITASNVACRMITSKGATLPGAEIVEHRETMEDTYTISLPYGTALETDYRITVNGAAFNVVRVVDGRTDAADVQAVLVRARGDE